MADSVTVASRPADWRDDEIIALALVTPELVGAALADAEQNFPELYALILRAQLGEELSADDIQQALEARMEAGTANLQGAFEQVVNGSVDLAVWQEVFATELMYAHIQAVLLATGDWTDFNAEVVEEKMIAELGFLNNFAAEIATGLTLAQIDSRLSQYLEGIWSTFWKGEGFVQALLGSSEEMRVLDAAAEHCDVCPSLAGHWEPIGSLPAPGEESPCGHRCRCTKEYR